MTAAAFPVWGDPAAWENPPPLDGSVAADVCVVGLGAESLAEIDRLAAELGPVVRRVGSLRIPASAEEVEDCARQLEVLRRHGFPARPADGPSGQGVFIPGDGSVQPLERCRLLAC